MKTPSKPTHARSFVAAVSAAWADCQNASRRLVEHQMGPKHPHNK